MTLDNDPERDALDRSDHGPPKLVKFRHMTGIDTPAILHNKASQRPAKNLGIYARIVSEERKATYQYYTMSLIINVSFMSQIVVAATLTALSAANTSHVLITILGSINTVIAGIQTYLKGQGLPNRLKQYQFGLRKLREFLEDRERDFSHKDCPLNVDKVIADVSAMYQAVRQTAEDNTPDTYLPMEGAGKKLLGQKDNRVTPAERLMAGDFNDDVVYTSTAKDTNVEESKNAEGSSGDKKAPVSAGSEDTEATPLLKQGDRKLS